MDKADPYTLLGIERNATDDQIKSAYRRVAKECHPDRNPDDETAEQRFKEVGEAYEILKDPQRREAYDRFGHADPRTAGGHPFGNGFNSSMSDIFEDLFGSHFGGQSGQGGRGRGQAGGNLRYDMEISLEDVLNGRTETIVLPRRSKCDTCEGSGAQKGTKPTTCQQCDGRGVVRSSQGIFTMERTCAVCSGAGEIIASPCNKCGGSGRVLRQKKLEIKVPSGIEENSRLRLRGEGEAGLNGGPPGDLFVFFTVREHPVFDRHGANLLCPVTIPMTKAALGGAVEIVTLDGGRTEVQIQPGTQSGARQRLRGKGVPSTQSKTRGDLYIHVQVETPVKLTSRQRELLREFQDSSQSENQPQSEGFIGKLKDFIERISK